MIACAHENGNGYNRRVAIRRPACVRFISTEINNADFGKGPMKKIALPRASERERKRGRALICFNISFRLMKVFRGCGERPSASVFSRQNVVKILYRAPLKGFGQVW